MKRVKYAEVVATLALFVALSGASYAAFELPANSVGARQLAFPLGLATSRSASGSFRAENCPPDAATCPPSLVVGTLPSTRVTLKGPAEVLVMGTATVDERGAGDRPVQLDISANLTTGRTTSTVGRVEDFNLGPAPVPLSFWDIVRARPGRQLFWLTATAISQAASPTTVEYRNARLLAIVLPHIR